MDYSTRLGMNIETIRLDARRYCQEFRIDPSLVDRMEISQAMTAIGEQSVRVLLNIASRKVDSKSVSYPDGWKQAVNQRLHEIRWWPKWAKRKWPIRSVTVTLEANALYPTIAIPNHSASVEVIVHKPTIACTNAQ